MLIRKATITDGKPLEDKFRLYLQECQDKGGEILTCQESVDFYSMLLDSLFKRDIVGACYVASKDGEILGFSLATAAPLPFPLVWGATATGWGTWVDPEHRQKGIGSMLRRRTWGHIKKQGMVALIGSVATQNPEGRASMKNAIPYNVGTVTFLEE